MDTERASVDYSGFGFLKTQSQEIAHQESQLPYGYDFAEEYLNMIEPTVDQLRSNSNPLLAIHDLAQQLAQQDQHESQHQDVDAFPSSHSNLNVSLQDFGMNPMQIDDFYKADTQGSADPRAAGHHSLDSYSNMHQQHHHQHQTDFQPHFGEAPPPFPIGSVQSDSTIHTDSMDTSSDADYESSPRSREKRKRSNSGEDAAASSHQAHAPPSSPPSNTMTPLGGKFRLQVGELPPKSRVETQIRLNLRLTDLSGTRQIVSYKHIILEDDMIVPNVRTNRKKDSDKIEEVDAAAAAVASGAPFLRLRCRVVTSTDADSDVHRCVACVMRERRMHARRTKGEVAQDESEAALEQDKRKILVFHSAKVVDFASGEATLPVRVTCYCRHHKEQFGFGLVVSLIDGYSGEIVGSSLVGYIMITDDHKSQQRRPSKKPKVRDDEPATSSRKNVPFLTVTIPSGDEDDNSSVSGSTSPMILAGPALPNFNSHMSFSGEPSPVSPPANPFESTLYQRDVSFHAQQQQPSGLQPFRMGAPTFDFSSTTGISGQLLPNNPSIYGNSVSASTGSRSAAGSPPVSPTIMSRPIVEKVIPQEGPISGGLEITVLGQNLLPTHRPFFGVSSAKVTTYWGPTTLVCVLPPATAAGTVPVYVLPPVRMDGLHPFESEPPGETNASFTYKDDSDKQLLELALQLIGMQMTGRLADARDVAREIVRQSSNPSSPNTSASGSGHGSPGSNHYSKESLVLKAMGSLLTRQLPGSELTEGAAPAAPFDLSLQNENGQTLLHLSILKNYTALFEILVRVIKGQVAGFTLDVNLPDWNGWTPLHLAAAHGRSEIVTTLLNECGALPIINDEVGLLPHDVVDAKQHPDLKAMLEKAASRYEQDLATASAIRSVASSAEQPGASSSPSLSSDSSILNTEDHIVSLPSASSAEFYADPNDDIEATKAANNAAALATASTISLLSMGKFRDSLMAHSAFQFMESVNQFWLSYRMAMYLGALLVLVSLSLLEVLPYNFRAGVAGQGFELTGSNSGFNPNKSKPDPLILPDSPLEYQLWNLYFLARLVVLCGILFGLVWSNRDRLRLRSPIAFGVAILFILIIFVFGSLYIFDFLPL